MQRTRCSAHILMRIYSKARPSAILPVATGLLGMLDDLKPVHRQLYVTVFRVVQHNHSVRPQVVLFQLQLTAVCVCDCVVGSSVENPGTTMLPILFVLMQHLWVCIR